MDTIYAFLVFLAVVFIVYQADRLFNAGLDKRKKRNDEIDRGEVQESTSEHLSDPVIAPTKSSNGTTKDEIIHDLAEENARLQAEVDALRKQLVAFFDSEESVPKRFEPGGEESHRVE